jgi:hypothetical protein
VEPQVSLTGPPESKALFTGRSNRVSFAGTVSANYTGAVVLLQREAETSYEEWVTIEKGVVGPAGVYIFTHTFVVPGDANIRAVVPAHGQYTVHGASSPLSYVISQKENPLLTLLATSATSAPSDPISYGQSVTLEGIVAGGAGKPVALQARTAGEHLLTASTVATATAGPGGQYKFQVTPRQNTFYKVISGTGAHSALLFEGVKYVLSAIPSASTLQDGQTLSFTGTVTPYLAGHVVYLERQNASGQGAFHLVSFATITPPVGGGAATFTLTHPVFGTGKQVYRVKVPGDPENQGQAGPPVTVEVTPAPPAALQPAPPSPLPGL